MRLNAAGGDGHHVLILDNEDSFTGSLVQYFRAAGARVRVERSRRPGLAEQLPALLAPDLLLVLSPGPGRPEDWPLLQRALDLATGPVFGVCLGLQAMVLHAGGVVGPARRVVHGRTSPVHHDGAALYAGLPSPFRAARYHSLAARGSQLPDTLRVDAWTLDRDGAVEEIMGISHRERPWRAVQFHPEAVRTESGLRLVENALHAAGGALRGRR